MSLLAKYSVLWLVQSGADNSDHSHNNISNSETIYWYAITRLIMTVSVYLFGVQTLLSFVM